MCGCETLLPVSAWQRERLVCHVQTRTTFEIGKPPRLVGEPVFNVDTFDYGCSAPVQGYVPPCGVRVDPTSTCNSNQLLRSTSCRVIQSVLVSTSVGAVSPTLRTLKVFGSADLVFESTEGTGTACAHPSTA